MEATPYTFLLCIVMSTLLPYVPLLFKLDLCQKTGPVLRNQNKFLKKIILETQQNRVSTELLCLNRLQYNW